MSESETKYDVAISFLHTDETLASAIDARLSEQFNVFVYSKRQEELAGTNGLESFREVFSAESRLVVVLYREGWGSTPFTRVEQQAITDRFLEDGWDFLLFVMLNHSDQPPKWLPKSEIRLSFQQYGLDQLLGAIKVRAQKLGSRVRSETTVDRAKRFEAESRARADREELLRNEGSAAVRQEWDRLVKAISAKITETNNHLSYKIHFAIGRDEFAARVRNISLTFCLELVYPTTESRINVAEWGGQFFLPNENRFRSPLDKLQPVARTSFYVAASLGFYSLGPLRDSGKAIPVDGHRGDCEFRISDCGSSAEGRGISASPRLNPTQPQSNQDLIERPTCRVCRK
jgi:hypothetical protein